MATTLIDNPTTNAKANPVRDSDVLVLRNKRSEWLLDIIVYGVLFGICSYVSGASIWFAIAGEGSRILSIVFACAALAVGRRLLDSALKRHDYYQDGEAKLTLSRDAICDHRTEVNLELLDVAAMCFDRRLANAREVRADLHVAMHDGSEHVFDLLHLNQSSQEIAWRVKNDAGIDEADGVHEPTGIGVAGYLLGAALLIGMLWQIYMHTEVFFSRSR